MIPIAELPYLDDDTMRIVVLHRRYLDPAGGACGHTPEQVARGRRVTREWFTIPLFLYDRGGTVYRVGRSNPFPCPWDSGRVGLIALRRDRWGNGRPPDEELQTCAAAVAKEYSWWANAECYGYVLRDVGGQELDSC